MSGEEPILGSEFWVDTWPGRFLVNSVGYVLVFVPILIGLFLCRKFLRISSTTPTRNIWEKFIFITAQF